MIILPKYPASVRAESEIYASDGNGKFGTVCEKCQSRLTHKFDAQIPTHKFLTHKFRLTHKF
jgi:hypothetical protein